MRVVILVQNSVRKGLRQVFWGVGQGWRSLLQRKAVVSKLPWWSAQDTSGPSRNTGKPSPRAHALSASGTVTPSALPTSRSAGQMGQTSTHQGMEGATARGCHYWDKNPPRLHPTCLIHQPALPIVQVLRARGWLATEKKPLCAQTTLQGQVTWAEMTKSE